MITLPDKPLGNQELTDDQIAKEIRMLAAVKLYEIGEVSSGRAAELAGIPRLVFLERLGKYKVSPFQITPEELRREVEKFECYIR